MARQIVVVAFFACFLLLSSYASPIQEKEMFHLIRRGRLATTSHSESVVEEKPPLKYVKSNGYEKLVNRHQSEQRNTVRH